MKFSTALAREFAELLRDYLTAEQIAAVDATNAERKDNTCASHDYCDANEVMIEAFHLTFGRDYTGDDYDTDIVNEAWSEAKAKGYAKAD